MIANKKEKDQKKEWKSQSDNTLEAKFLLLQEENLKLGVQIQRIGQEKETRSRVFKNKKAPDRS